VPAAAFDTNNVEEIEAKLLALHRTLGAWPELSAPALGVTWEPGAGDMAILKELGVLATLVEGLPAQPQVFAFVAKLRESSFFTALGHSGEGLEAALDALEPLAVEPWARPLFERLVHARFVARRASAKIDLLYQVRNAPGGREAVELLREHLTGPQFAEAPFWVLRELVRLGVIGDVSKVGSCALVPTQKLIASARKIGLTNGEIHDFDGFVQLAEAASKVAGGVEAGYGAALERLDDGLGLRLS